MADNPITVDLPADLPTNWQNAQIVAPNGADVGQAEQYGYNYLAQQVNAVQQAAKEIGEAFAKLYGKGDILDVESGGTGKTTFPAGNILLGNLKGPFNSTPQSTFYNKTTDVVSPKNGGTGLSSPTVGKFMMTNGAETMLLKTELDITGFYLLASKSFTTPQYTQLPQQTISFNKPSTWKQVDEFIFEWNVAFSAISLPNTETLSILLSEFSNMGTPFFSVNIKNSKGSAASLPPINLTLRKKFNFSSLTKTLTSASPSLSNYMFYNYKNPDGTGIDMQKALESNYHIFQFYARVSTDAYVVSNSTLKIYGKGTV